MMKGNNTLKLNPSTMIIALQLWADKEFVNPPKIESIKEETDGYAKVFSVEVSGPDTTEQP